MVKKIQTFSIPWVQTLTGWNKNKISFWLNSCKGSHQRFTKKIHHGYTNQMNEAPSYSILKFFGFWFSHTLNPKFVYPTLSSNSQNAYFYNLHIVFQVVCLSMHFRYESALCKSPGGDIYLNDLSYRPVSRQKSTGAESTLTNRTLSSNSDNLLPVWRQKYWSLRMATLTSNLQWKTKWLFFYGLTNILV